jgi:hypothetical protein
VKKNLRIIFFLEHPVSSKDIELRNNLADQIEETRIGGVWDLGSEQYRIELNVEISDVNSAKGQIESILRSREIDSEYVIEIDNLDA